MKNNLKHRELTNEAKQILLSYFMCEITFIEAHNKLIGFGINLTEENELKDY